MRVAKENENLQSLDKKGRKVSEEGGRGRVAERTSLLFPGSAADSRGASLL